MNRKTLLIIVAVIGVLFFVGAQKTEDGDPIQMVGVAQIKCPWRQIGQIDTAVTAPSTTDGSLLFSSMVTVTASASSSYFGPPVYTATDSDMVVWRVPADVRNVQFSFLTTSDADSHTVNVYRCDGQRIQSSAVAATSDPYDSFYLAATLTLTGGTMYSSATTVFVDTIVSSDATVDTTIEDSANNRRAIVSFNVEGAEVLAFATTSKTADKTLSILVRWGN